MRKLFFLICAIIISFICSHAQFVGIGSTSPFGKLQINHKGVGNNPALVLFDSTSGTGSEIRFVKQGLSTAFNFNMNTVLTGVASTSFWKFNAGSNPSMTINGNGHIYFGANTPAYVSRFNFDGAVNFTDNLTMNGDAGQIGQPLISNSENFGAPAWYPNAYFTGNGKVGLGTDVPAAKLQINHTNTSGSPSLILFDSTAGTGSRLQFKKQSQGNSFSLVSNIDLLVANSALDIRGTSSSIMFLRGDLHVGINNTNPDATLHVGGGVKIQDTLNVAGNLNADTIKPNALKLVQNAGPGKILTSDASGNANWQASSTGGGVGFGAWGDCSTNSISEYNPVEDTPVNGGDDFGNSVSISGNYAIVGAVSDEVGANANQGSASIFQWNGTNWVLMNKITDATGAAGDNFGFSVSISGNYAIVGAYHDDVGANADQGSASIYQWNGTNWVLMIKITDATGAASDEFGNSVSISGNYAIVGAPNDDVGANADQGSASIYILSGGITWILMNKITDATGAATDNFGGSVSISGSYAIVGAPSDDVTFVTQGSASIFRQSGLTWLFMNKISDATGGSGDFFGTSVSISGNYVIVGASGDDVGANTNQGSATIYQRVGLGWGKLQYVTDPAGNSNDQFGGATAIDGTSKRFLIGSSNYAGNSGKAVFGKVN